MFTHRQITIMLFWAFSSVALMLTVPFTQDIAQRLLRIRSALYVIIQKNFFNSKQNLNNSKLFTKSSRKEVIIDCLFLCSVVILSLASYIYKLGFYSDDWAFLGSFSLSHNQSIFHLYQVATTPNTFMRPMQNLYDAILFWLFGLNPLGYQLVNALVFISIIILFYLILRQLKISRIITIAVPLVYALLPNYSTDRFWYAAFQVNLSMLFFLLSTYAGLKALSQYTARVLQWKILSITSLVISAFSYEVALPLVFFNMLLFWNPGEKFIMNRGSKKSISQNHAVFILLNFIVLLYLIIFKEKTTTRLGSFNYPKDVIHLIISTFQTNFGTLGIKLPYIWGEILSLYVNSTTLIIGAILFIVIFLYLYLTVSKLHSLFPDTKFMRNLTFLGIVIFLLGYAIFFTSNKVGFSPTGIDNRVAIAASIGIAFIAVGVVGLISNILLPKRFSRWFFCVLIAIMCTGGFFVINTLASFWISAYSQGQSVLSDIHYYFPIIPKNSTIILDGVCPYFGPGIVFESQWDLKGALQTIYHDPTLQADIVTPRLTVTKKAIETEIYTFKTHYPYRNLFIYNFKQKKAYPILNEEMANTYFQEFNPDYNNNCPPSSAGNGVSVF